MSVYFRAVPITEEGTDEPVQYVGIHPIAWNRHPEHPTAGFIPVEGLEEQLQMFAAACEAALIYDLAIKACSNDPKEMASFCTSKGDTLDTLYLDWQTKSREALVEYRNSVKD